MTSEQQPRPYRVEILRYLSDDTPLWGVRRPDGGWRPGVDGAPGWCIRKEDAERSAAELNEIHGLVPSQP